MHSRSGAILGNKYVIFFALYFHEAKALGMADESSLYRWAVCVFRFQAGKTNFRIFLLITSARAPVLVSAPAVTSVVIAGGIFLFAVPGIFL